MVFRILYIDMVLAVNFHPTGLNKLTLAASLTTPLDEIAKELIILYRMKIVMKIVWVDTHEANLETGLSQDFGCATVNHQ